VPLLQRTSSFTATETCGSQAALYGKLKGKTAFSHTDIQFFLFHLLKEMLEVEHLCSLLTLNEYGYAWGLHAVD